MAWFNQVELTLVIQSSVSVWTDNLELSLLKIKDRQLLCLSKGYTSQCGILWGLCKHPRNAATKTSVWWKICPHTPIFPAPRHSETKSRRWRKTGKTAGRMGALRRRVETRWRVKKGQSEGKRVEWRTQDITWEDERGNGKQEAGRGGEKEPQTDSSLKQEVLNLSVYLLTRQYSPILWNFLKFEVKYWKWILVLIKWDSVEKLWTIKILPVIYILYLILRRPLG